MASIPGVTEAASASSRAISKAGSQATKAASGTAAKTAGSTAKGAAQSTTQRMSSDARQKVVDKAKDSLHKKGQGEPAVGGPSDAPLDGEKVSGTSGPVKGSSGLHQLDEAKSRKQDARKAQKDIVNDLKAADGGGPINKAYGVAGGALTGAYDASKSSHERRKTAAEDKKVDSDRVKAFDKFGARGDAETSGGKAKRKTARRLMESIGDSRNPLTPVKKTKAGSEAIDEAKKVVPEGVRKTAGRAKRDAKRVVEETANDALDGFVEGGTLPGALLGAGKGFLRGIAQSKTFWGFLGLGAIGLSINAAILALILVVSGGVAKEVLDDWRVQAGIKAAEAAGTVKGWYDGAVETAHKAADGVEWVAGAAVEKGAGIIDGVGDVVNGDSQAENSAFSAENSAFSATNVSGPAGQAGTYPTYGQAPDDWDIGDPVYVNSISEVVMKYEGGGWYSINGDRVELVRMTDEAEPVTDYISDVQVDLGTLAEANVFVIGDTAPEDTEPTAKRVSIDEALGDETSESSTTPEMSVDNLGLATSAEKPDDDADEPDESDEPDEKSEDEDEKSEDEDSKDEEKSEDDEKSEDEDSKDDEETLGEAAKKWKIDEDKAKKEGVPEDQLKNYTDSQWRSYIYGLLSEKVRAAQNKEGFTGDLSSGMSINSEGIGFISENDAAGSNLAEKVKKTYLEAIKSLPIKGVEEKAEEIFQDSRDWWYGQSCAADGSDVGDSGNFTGKGVPEKAVPWVKNAAKHSENKIPAAFFAYIMDRETDFRPDLFAMDKNGGTWGLFQINRVIWEEVTDGGSFDDPDITDPMVHTEYGAKYFDDRLNTVRKMRKNNPDKPYAKDLTELEALMIAHNAGEGNLQKYPNLPAITRGYLKEFREKFEDFGGGEPGDASDSGGGDDSGGSDSGGGGEASGKLIKPQGKHAKTSERGWREHPVTGGKKFHAGTDYGMPAGTELPAMFDGKVTFNGWMTGYGNYVIVKGKWDGKELGYAYAHMTESKVKVGQELKAGDLVGTSGNTGIGSGPHLHLELRTADFTGPGREGNTADADKFLKSNGGEITGGAAAPAEPGEDDGCPGDAKGSSDEGGDGSVSNEECKQGKKIEGGLTESAISVYRSVCAEFPKIKSYGGRRYSSIIGNKSDHYTGKAVDVMINDSGKNDRELGDNVSKFVQKNAKELDIKYIIWDQQIWYPSRGDWKDMADRGSPTQNHKDHVHVSVNS